MPYIITTHAPRDAAPFDARARVTFEPTRRAVATLEEARTHVLDYCEGRAPTYAVDVPESGGTIGPLPDGTRIGVERVDWPELSRRWRCGEPG